MASSSANPNPSSVDDIFNDFKLRRTALITALTTDVDSFMESCTLDLDSGIYSCPYGLSDGQWRVSSPMRAPSDFPEPTIGINYLVNSPDRVSWLCSVAVHSDCWLLSMIGYYTAGLSRVDRRTVLCMACTLETVYETVALFYHRGVDSGGAGDNGLDDHTSLPCTLTIDASLETIDDVLDAGGDGLTALADAAAIMTAAATAPVIADAVTAAATAPVTADATTPVIADATAPVTADAVTADPSPDDSLDLDIAELCGSCHRRDPVDILDIDADTRWIQCDTCDLWFHEICTGLSVAQFDLAQIIIFALSASPMDDCFV